MVESYKNRTELQYTISNDIRCPSPFVEEIIFDWRNNTDDFGWTSVFNVTDLSTIGGNLSGYALTDSMVAYVDQPLPKVAINPSVNRIDIALRVKSDFATRAKLQFMKSSNEDTSPEVLAALGQEIEFDLIPDKNFHLYKIDPTPIEAWQGLITHFRLFPGLGMNPGDSFYVEFIRVLTKNTSTTCVCDESDLFYEAPSPCTGAGRAASIEGVITNSNEFTIGPWNDRLSIRMNDSATRTLSLPHTNLPKSGAVIAEIIEFAINRLSGFGFKNTRFLYLKDSRFRLEGGIRGSHTSVEVDYEEKSVLKSLGFFDPSGRSIYTSYTGVDDDTSPPYFDINNSEMKAIREGTLANAMTFAPDNFWIEVGNPFHAEPPFHTTYDGRNKTLIDYLKPATASGKIDRLYFSGTVFESPQTKIKLFRPTQENGLKFIAEYQIKPIEFFNTPKISLPLLPYNQVRFDYSVDVDLYVQEGDFLGIYNSVIYGDFVLELTRGHDVNELQRIMRSFLLVEDDVTYDLPDISSLQAFGESLTPLPIYGRSEKRKRKTSFFIDLGEKKAVDKVLFNYKVSEFIKTTSNLSSQVTTVDVNTHGSAHTHWRYIATSNGLEQVTTVHTTSALNKQLLVDGIKESYNADPSTYFYLDGDGELSNTDFQAPGIVQETSFRDDRFDIQINLSQNFDKEVGAITIWFIENQNWTQYGIFYKSGSTKIPFTLNAVLFDDRPVGATSIYKKNPLVLDSSAPTDANYSILAAGISVPHRKVTFIVEPVETKTVIFEVYQHHSTKISEIELLSTELVSEDGYEIKGSDMFTVYVAEEDFEFKEVGFFTDNVVETAQVNTSLVDVGKPVRYLKVEVEPLVILDLYNIKVLSEKKDHLTPLAGPDGFVFSSTEETVVNLDFQEDRIIEVENKLDQTADLLVDMLRSDESTRRETVIHSSLSSVESLNNPTLGPSARYNALQDVELKIRFDVAKDRVCYGTYELNEASNGDSDWQNLGTLLTDGGSVNTIDPPIGKDSTSDESQVFYRGEAVSGGVFTESFNISYTVVIDNSNGLFAGNASGFVPTFTVTSVPSIDDVSTSIEILDYGVFYPVGTLGVLIKFEGNEAFGNTDIFIINARPATITQTNLNARDYGHVAIDLGSQFEIESIEIDASFERVGSNSVSWKNDSSLIALSDSRTNKISGVHFKRAGILAGLTKWVRLDYDFTQPTRGGTLDNVKVYTNHPVFYSDYWWTTTPSNGGSVDVDRENSSGATSLLSSLKLSYLIVNQEVQFVLDEGEIDFDEFWSFRDFLTFYYSCSESSNIEYLKVRIGSSSSHYYEWDLTLSPTQDNTWTQAKLKFEYGEITGQPELYSSIGYFCFIAKASSRFSLNLDALKITRNRFDDVVKYSNGVYLNNREFIVFSPVDRLSLREGSLDFWAKFDFNSAGYFENEEVFDPDTLELTREYKYYFDKRELTSSILTLTAGLDFKCYLVAQPGINGLFIATNNFVGEKVLFTKKPSFSWDNSIHHIGLAWRYDAYSMNVEIHFYLDGVLSQMVLTPWVPTREDSPSIILGGVGDSKLFAVYPSSANSTLENLRVFNFFRSDFSSLMTTANPPSSELKTTDLFLVSVNDTGFVEYGSPAFPIVVEDVAPGDTVPIAFRMVRPQSDIPSLLPRRARVELKWRP